MFLVKPTSRNLSLQSKSYQSDVRDMKPLETLFLKEKHRKCDSTIYRFWFQLLDLQTGWKIIFSMSLFSVQQLPNIMPLIKCVQCEHIVDALFAIICSYMFSCSKSNKCGCCVNRFLQNQSSYEQSLCHSLSDQIEVLFRLVFTYICLKP